MRTCFSTVNRYTFSAYIVFNIVLFLFAGTQRVNKEMAITTKKSYYFFSPLIIRAIYYILHCALYVQAANNVLLYIYILCVYSKGPEHMIHSSKHVKCIRKCCNKLRCIYT
jgi:hypothetical protein